MPSSRLPNSQNPAGAVNPSHRPPSTVQSGPDSICTTADPWLWDKVGYVGDACRLAVGYTGPAVGKRLGEDFEAIVQSLVPMLLAALAGVLTTTLIGAGIGSLAGGVGAAPGAMAGFQVGLWLLNFVGLGFLAVYIIDNVGDLKDCLNRAVTLAWNSCGDPSTLDASARQFAEAVAIFFSLLVQAIVVYLTKEAARGRPSEAISTIGKSKLAKWSPGLMNWLAENFGRLRSQMKPASFQELPMDKAVSTINNTSVPTSWRVRVRGRIYRIDRNPAKGHATKHLADLAKDKPWATGSQTDMPIQVLREVIDQAEATILFRPQAASHEFVVLKNWEVGINVTGKEWLIYHLNYVRK